MAIRVKIIQNVSNQAIEILHQQGDVDNAAGDVPYAKTGMLRIMPTKQVTIEEARVNLGQLKNLEAKNLLKVTDSLV